MVSVIWFGLITVAVLVATINGDLKDLTTNLLTGSNNAVSLGISLLGVLAFWSGVMEIAKQARLINLLGQVLNPILRCIFPNVPKGSKAQGALVMAIAANILGMGNAATPLGIKAMEELHRLNPTKNRPSAAMCTLVVLSTSSLTLIPTTVLTLRTATQSQDPSAIIATTILATTASTTTGLLFDRLLRRR